MICSMFRTDISKKFCHEMSCESQGVITDAPISSSELKEEENGADEGLVSVRDHGEEDEVGDDSIVPEI